jgi:hypothetical protein
MDLKKFRAGLETEVFSRLNSLERMNTITGTNSARIQHIINWAVKCLPEGEAYLEVGCLHGSSLAAASFGNDDKIKYAVDIEIQGQMQYIIDTTPNLTFHLGNYFDMELEDFIKHKIGVYYYDADHGYLPTWDALSGIIPYLSDSAVILMDDLHYNRVFNAWREFAAEDENFVIVHEFWTPDQFIGLTKGYPENWWDGFGIAEYEKKWNREPEEVEDIVVQVWHGLGEHKGRQGTVYPKELKHLHGREEQKL